jgi:hypothetical protein
MAQTTYLGFVTTPSGKRLVMQAGTHALTTSATECTLSIQMRRVVAAHATTGQAQTLNKTHKIAYFPYYTATDLTSLQLATGWKAKGQTLVRLVEFIDRADVMVPALEALCAAAPNDPMLEMVRDGHRRWDNNSRAMLSELVGNTAAT